MLSNPHWNAPSLSSFEAWLETKDPEEAYHFVDWHNCACAQYLKHVGKYNDHWLGSNQELKAMNSLASGVLGDTDYTFGALLRRVRAHRQLVLT